MLSFAIGAITIIVALFVFVMLCVTISWMVDTGIMQTLFFFFIIGVLIWAAVSAAIAVGDTIITLS